MVTEQTQNVLSMKDMYVFQLSLYRTTELSMLGVLVGIIASLAGPVALIVIPTLLQAIGQ